MSTTTVTHSPDTTGWLLEMTGNGDSMVSMAVKPGGDIMGVIFRSISKPGWWGWSDSEPAPCHFSEHADAIAWLSDWANLSTQAVAS